MSNPLFQQWCRETELSSLVAPQEPWRVLSENSGGGGAILTVLDPRNFTVYDTRVCGQLEGFWSLDRLPFDLLWSEYLAFRDAVRRAVPSLMSLRGKDRYPWGKSFAEGLEDELKKGWPVKAPTDGQKG